MRIGIDAGGTFTDFVIEQDDGTLTSFKIRSDRRNPARVIREGILRAAAGTRDVRIIHGSTVATNALLERKGARTALVTTEGFEDVLRIGRQNRPELYNLTPEPRPAFLPDELLFGVPERMLRDGQVLEPLGAEALAELRRRLEEAKPESIAICLLHSYANAVHEEAVLEAVRGLGYVCASHQISPEFREFERTSTTVINAYVGPLMRGYLDELARTADFPIAIMQSNGGFLTAAEAGDQAVRTILSGPAGGIVGAVAIAQQCGFARALTFDMGGTSTDVSLAGAERRFTLEARISDLPVRVPMLDIHTVGAGGGSLARVDSGGALLVGPESAGSDPGPACYGLGELPAVTDAHVVLGRIAADQFLGGAMHLYPDRAARAIDPIARALKIDRIAAAEGIVRVANAHMERAIRVVSVERGEDPRDFPLIAFGGCGGLHACEIAEGLGIRTVIFPSFAGALSALGMLLAERTRDYSRSVVGGAEMPFAELERRARAEMPEGRIERYADLRYRGQSYELTVPARESLIEDFHQEHQRVYGYSDRGRPVETVAIRVRAIEAARPLEIRPEAAATLPAGKRRVRVAGRWRQLDAIPRAGAGDTPGPCLILDYGSTALVPPGWVVRRHASGNLVASRRR